MNNCIAFDRTRVSTADTSISQVSYCNGIVTAVDLSQHQYSVDGVAEINVADSLLVKPEVGDLVAYLVCEQGCFVIQVLVQSNKDTRQLTSELPLQISAPSISIAARDELDMVSLNRFSLVSKQGAISVAGTLVTCAEHLIQQVNHLLLNAKGLLRMSAKQQVITAEEDVRIDGKRINMG